MMDVNDLKNKIEFLKEQNKDLNQAIIKLKKENHQKKIRIDELENGLLELRKIIENVHHERILSVLYEKSTNILYPKGKKNETTHTT